MSIRMKNLFWKLVERVVNHKNFYLLHSRKFTKTASPAFDDRLQNAATQTDNPPYQDMAPCEHENSKIDTHPVFITARFRSGSTLLWNIFRHTNGIHSYYEPLNEGLCFNQSLNTRQTDETHIGVDNYWSEYSQASKAAELFSPEWARHNLLMDKSSYNRDMKRYIEELIASADGRAVLQFNRVDFRLPWLHANFSHASIVHLYRHPRELWTSVCSKSSPVGLKESNHDYSQYNLFYTMEWAHDLMPNFPFLDPALNRHPYYYHYLLWKLSYIYGKAYADISISYEDLISKPTTTLQSLATALQMDALLDEKLVELIGPAKPMKWPGYADNTWFNDIEDECNTIVDAFFSSSNI